MKMKNSKCMNLYNIGHKRITSTNLSPYISCLNIACILKSFDPEATAQTVPGVRAGVPDPDTSSRATVWDSLLLVGATVSSSLCAVSPSWIITGFPSGAHSEPPSPFVGIHAQ